MMIENQYVKYDITAALKHFKGKIIGAVILGKDDVVITFLGHSPVRISIEDLCEIDTFRKSEGEFIYKDRERDELFASFKVKRKEVL